MEHDVARLRALFDEVMQAPPESRAALLTARCGDDIALRRRVEALIATAEADEPFLSEPTRNKPPLNLASTADPGPLSERPGTRIGPYKLLQTIGEGGFGVVFMAEQDQPVRRRVALKIIKLGMDTRQVVARFEQECQALALMDHPNIARVFDGGATDSGRPYFVMEYVIGDPITAFADAHKLSVRQRLDLFAQVCGAVQHAHTKGVIHRDIKPRNVLVSMVDGRPFAKVIDFGIAKATGARLTDKTLFTEHRQLIGTPEYMSPEQAEGSPDIDTRTDVYALGVLLYELLTGATPFDAERLRSAAYAEMQRIIKEEEPPVPSVRLSRDLATLAATAAARQAEPSKLGTLIKGELDWIVMKSLDKDRARRYETPNQLAADVQRHLAGEPVQAAPPSAGYRLRKFVRKHRGPVTAGSLITLTLLLAIVATTWQWRRAAKEADRSERVAAMVDLFGKAHEELATSVRRAYETGSNGEDLGHGEIRPSSRELVRQLDNGALGDSPRAEIALRYALVRALSVLPLGQWDGERAQALEGGLVLAERWLGTNHPTTVQILSDLPGLYYPSPYVLSEVGLSREDRLRKARSFYSKLEERLRPQESNVSHLTIEQWASRVVGYSSQYGDSDWAAMQALDEPDTFRFGDIVSAWAPQEASGGEQFLSLAFAHSVLATGVMIRETCGNGFVVQIDLIDDLDALHAVWVGHDPSRPGSPVDFFVSFEKTNYLVNGVKIYVDTERTRETYEEIDAVKLYGHRCPVELLGAAAAARQNDLEVRAAERKPAGQYVQSLLRGPIKTQDFDDAVFADPSMPPLRRLLVLAQLREEKENIDGLARKIFDEITKRHMTTARVKAAAESAELQPRVREAVLLKVTIWKPTAFELNMFAWEQVKSPGAPSDAVAAALDASLEANRLQPNNSTFANTLGAVRYRGGQFEDALRTLTRPNQLNNSAVPADSAFLAMTHFKLGVIDKAREELARLRTLMADPANAQTWAKSADAKALLAEAEALIAGPSPVEGDP